MLDNIENGLALGAGQNSVQVQNQVQNQPIMGASGKSYVPMNTSPEAQTNQQLTHLFNQLQQTIQAIIQVSITTQQTPQADFQETVATVLENSDWFAETLADLVHDRVKDEIDNVDVTYEVQEAVERALQNDVDVRDMVDDEVGSVIDGIVEDKLREILSTATIRIES